jgi:hypothetical protein
MTENQALKTLFLVEMLVFYSKKYSFLIEISLYILQMLFFYLHLRR